MSSGWIKFDKDTAEDPRVFRMASLLARRYAITLDGADTPAIATQRFLCNAVTGALVTLWKYADEHIATQDDTLPIDSQTLDALVSLPGFAACMPREWLIETDDGGIKLPGYSEKNSLIAKRERASQSKARVRKWRANRSSRKPDGNDIGNGHETHPVTRYVRTPYAHSTPLVIAEDLDQDQDLYQEQSQKKEKNGNAHGNGVTAALHTESPPEPWEEVGNLPRSEAADRLHGMTGIKADWPPGGRSRWIQAEHSTMNLVKNGKATWEELHEAVRRYRAWCKETGTFVMDPAKFFSDLDEPWSQAWDIPQRPARGLQTTRVAKTTEEYEAEERARANH